MKKNDFYSESVLDAKILDRFKYRGKGRPRKQDYSTVRHMQKKHNTYMDILIKGQWKDARCHCGCGTIKMWVV